MGLLADLLSTRAKAASGLAEPQGWFVDFLGGGPTLAGTRVTPDSALAITAVWNAVRILSSAQASLPLILYRKRRDGGKERAVDHPLYRLAHDAPNPKQTRYEFIEMMTGHEELRGNAYAVIGHDRRGAITSLTPLHPDRVMVFIAPDESLWYEYTTRGGRRIPYSADEILHLRGYSSDGIMGLNPIGVVRESLGITLAADAHAASFYGNSATPGGVLKHPGKLSKDAYERLKESWKARHAGTANAWKPAILEEGLDWTTIGMSSRDAQFIENRRFQIDEVARIFDLPPHKLKQLDRATFSNIEHQGLEFLQDSIRPRLVRKEQRLNEALLLEREREEGYFFEFLVDAMLRADLKTRYEAYAIGRTNGWLCADDIRSWENMNPLPDGKGQEFLNPLNMAPAGSTPTAPAKPSPKAPPASDPSNDPAEDLEDEPAARALAPAFVARGIHGLLLDAARRAIRKEISAARRQVDRTASPTELNAWFEGFWAEHTRTLEQQLAPVVRAALDLAAHPGDRDLLTSTFTAGMLTREHEAAGVAFTIATAHGRESARSLLDAWESTRPEQLVARELPRLTEVLSSRGLP